MGTDVHAIAQRRTAGGWEDVIHQWKEDRHYKLFAWIGNVRNGYGFAGVPLHTPIMPLSDNRGFPLDFEVTDGLHPIRENALRGSRAKWYKKEDEDPLNPDRLKFWMGDHSFSWLSWDEILDSKNPLVGTINTGVIDARTLKSWDKKSSPPSWCGSVCGRGINVCEDIDLFDPKLHTHCQVEWETSSDEFDYFIEETRRLVKEHNQGRWVLGFDS
jgi:hypothetical protein